MLLHFVLSKEINLEKKIMVKMTRSVNVKIFRYIQINLHVLIT